MAKRTIMIFSLFIAFALVASIFIYFYRSQVDILIKNYVAKITICGNITDETDCYSRDYCEGIYGPSCPDCQDLEFKRCQRIPLNVLVKFDQEKKRCQQTGGQWYRNKLGNFCLCQTAGVDKIFDKTLGCVSK